MKKNSKLLLLLLPFFLICIVLPFGVSAKELDEKLVYLYGNNNASGRFNDLIVTDDGYYIAVGYTNANKIGEFNNNGGTDALIVKYDSDLNIIWQKNYGGSDYDAFNTIERTKDGGFIVSGLSTSQDIPGIMNKNTSNVIVVKYNRDGNVEWQSSEGYQQQASHILNSIIETKDGGYVAVGYASINPQSAVILKYSSEGELVWSKVYSGTYATNFSDVVEAKDGGIVVVGYGSGIPGLSDLGGTEDAIIVKYDKDGTMLWQKNYGARNNDRFYGLTSTSDGGYVAVGYAALIPGLNTNGYDGIITKFDENGKLLWQNNYGGNSYDYFMAVSQTKDNGYIVVGYTLDATGIDGITSKGSTDALLVKYDKNGTLEWQRNYVEDNKDYLKGVAVTKNDGYVAVGYSFISNNDSPFIIRGKYNYNITKHDSENGSFDVVEENGREKITVSPNDGYKLKEIIIKDSNGNKVNYTHEDDFYYFDLYDDVEVEVIFEKVTVEEIIENPNTESSNLFVFIIISMIVCTLCVFAIRKKRNIFKI